MGYTFSAPRNILIELWIFHFILNSTALNLIFELIIVIRLYWKIKNINENKSRYVEISRSIN